MVVVPTKVNNRPKASPKLPDLTPCALKMLKAIADPFDPGAIGCCVPTVPSRPTRKARGFIRGTFVIGENGEGYIGVSPCLAANIPQLWCTGTGFNAGAFAPYDNVVVPVLQPFYTAYSMGNLPYQFSELWSTYMNEDASTEEVTGRIVSAGLSIQAIGPTLYTGGQVTAYAPVDRLNLVGATNSFLSGFPDSDVSAPMRKKVTLSVFPTSPIEWDLSAMERASRGVSATPTGAAAAVICPLSGGFKLVQASGQADASADARNCGGCIMLFHVSGQPGYAYKFEYVLHAEYIGRLAMASSTENSEDIEGLNAVVSAAGHAQAIKANHSMSWKQALLRGLQRVAVEAVPVASRVIVAALGAI